MKTKLSLLQLALCTCIGLSGCREYADSPVIYQQIQQTVSSSPAVEKWEVDIDKDGNKDLYFNALNNNEPAISLYDNALFLEDISAKYDFDLLFSFRYSNLFVGQLYVLHGLAKGAAIDASTTAEDTGWRPINLEGTGKHLISQYSNPLISAWYHNVFDYIFPVTTEAYLPFRAVEVSNGNTYYGWIRLKDIRTTDFRMQKMKVVDMGLNTYPGVAILAGQKE